MNDRDCKHGQQARKCEICELEQYKEDTQKLLKRLYQAIQSTGLDTFGEGKSYNADTGEPLTYPIRDELLHDIAKRID